MAKKNILDRHQQSALALAKENQYIARNFYLTGGTALAAFYLRHRRSYDLDFFTDGAVDLASIATFMRLLQKALSAAPFTLQRVHDRNIFTSRAGTRALKIEFTHYPFKALKARRIVEKLRVDSLLDIAANKLFAAIDRNEPKDLVDLAFLLQEKFSITALIKAVEKKFGFAIDANQLLVLYKRGAEAPFAREDLARKPKIGIEQFYSQQLKELGKKILIP